MEKQSKEEEMDYIVESWFLGVFHNQGLSTEQFNRFQAAKQDLKERLRAAVKENTDA